MEKTIDSISGSEPEKLKNNSIELILPCHAREIPLWLVMLDNVPTVIFFTLGFLIINKLSTIIAIIFGSYALFSVVWFWAKICPFCHHFNTFACPCGYGVISSKLFKKGTGKSFNKVFRRNISIQFPNWFVPLVFAVYLVSSSYTKEILVLSIFFVLIGFVIIPLISKFVGCKNCEIREDCPWMTISKKEKVL
jgi:hypothetical protein